MTDELENIVLRLKSLEEKRDLGVWEKSNIIFSGIGAITSIFAIAVSIYFAKENIKFRETNTGLTEEKKALEKKVSNTQVAGKVEKDLQNKNKEAIDTYLNTIAITSPKQAKGVFESLSNSTNIDISSSADTHLQFLALVEKIETGKTKTDRTSAMDELTKSWSTYPNFVPILIEETNGKIQVQSNNGLWNIRLINTLVLFDKIDVSILLKHKNILNPWLSEIIRKTGPKTKTRAKLIFDKLNV